MSLYRTLQGRILSLTAAATLAAALAVGGGCQSDSSVGSDGGTNQNTNQNAGSDAALPADAAPPDAALPLGDPHLMPDLGITAVEVFQAVQVPIYASGTPIAHAARNSPVVVGRDALVRIYVAPTGAWSPREVRAELFVGPAGVRPFDPTDPGAAQAVVLEDAITVSGASSEANPGTTFNLLVPASHVSASPARSWAVRLVDPTGAAPAVPAGTAHNARVPADGLSAHALDARADNGGIQLVLVPLRYDYDGSGRLPDTSPTQLGIIEDLLENLYPTSQVSITVHAAIPWSDSPTWTGNFDFGDLNDYLVDLRANENAPAQAYYYGLVNPDPTFSDYCSGTCTTGQSYVVSSPGNGDFRVGAGVGFSGESSAWTLAHELGHMHGQGHSPCDVSSSEPGYPYSGGSIGVYGIDLRPSPAQLLSPSTYSDVMGYCDDQWISDYTYEAFWTRMIAVNALPPPPLPDLGPAPAARPVPQAYRALRLSPSAPPAWGRRLRSGTASRSDDARILRLLDPRGRLVDTVIAPLLRLAHHGEARLLLPEPFPAGATQVELPGDRGGVGAGARPTRLALPR